MIHETCLRYVLILGLIASMAMVALNTLGEIHAASAQPDSHKVIAYYFHTNTR